MKAIVVEQGEGAPVLEWKEVPEVTNGPDEVLLEVKASAVNRADLSQALGNYPPPPGVTDVLGLEASGIVRAVGSEVGEWHEGDHVCCLLPGGGYAERVTAPSGMLLRLPDSWSFEEGAAIPEVWLTAFVNLFQEGELQTGETVLLHAGGSGVGTAAIQLGKVVGATVIVTAGTEEKLDMARELGASLAVNYKTSRFAEEVMAFTGSEGVDLILDPVGASHFSGDLEILRGRGRLIIIGLLSGAQAEIDLGRVLGKSLRIIGSRLRPRPVQEKIAITGAFAERFWPLFEEGTLKPVIDRVFPLPSAAAAHEYVRQNRNIGKVILSLDDD
ncbi:MAG TPA: NAD(P)H-quinone oxidoreductase [Candidatus Binatia bacterium]|jgi:putative PIG3 family NAD(P)H quinone oxidoreductase|nr:NAD(P)H-quinone oxidoreductase [Candidatus Binatia bacterium]